MKLVTCSTGITTRPGLAGGQSAADLHRADPARLARLRAAPHPSVSDKGEPA